jgi:hypothetical protein
MSSFLFHHNPCKAETSSAKIENTILCSNVRIGAKAQIKDCEFGTGFEAKAEGKLRVLGF